MAYTTITFKHPVTTEMKQAPVGFSWTTLFFGLFPALFRSDWKWAGIQFLCAAFTWGLSSFVFCFIYNSLHIKDLVNKGFKATSILDNNLDLASSKVGISIPKLNEDKNEKGKVDWDTPIDELE